MIPFNIIVAFDVAKGIGKNGKLPWHLSADLKHFKAVTTQTENKKKKNIVIMGRKTWKSLPEKYCPLPERINLVLTQNKDLKFPPEVLSAESFEQVFQILERQDIKDAFESVFVIGGAQIFQTAMQYPACQKIYATHILSTFECDTFFPHIEDRFEKKSSSAHQKEGHISYYFAEYVRKSPTGS